MSARSSTLQIGRASRFSTLRPQEGVVNVAVREGDLDAVLGIIRAREEQIVRFGHGPDEDARMPAAHLPREAERYAMGAVEDIQFGNRRDSAIKRLERSAALCIAAIARLRSEKQ